ncbi:phospholipase D-like domain-containing protein [Parasphingorhabdus sp. JC815]|uniref:phospholipase D-like domain-containing protein n=1 Tax=Parasphingorhabdus sp. JC815 TaxID=3232140 RepID=UPI0034596F2A
MVGSTDIFDNNRNCWAIEKADKASVIIDAEHYFRHLRQAMKNAQRRIILIGWDFDSRVEMHDTEQTVEGPLEIGHYVDWLVKRNPELQIFILRWDTGAIKSLFRGRTLLTLARWRFHPRIHLKLDSKHPVGAAQHQKLAIIDEDTAFCGGIDITDNRWDTRAHNEVQPLRAPPSNTDAGPWHDLTMAVQGPAAKKLAEFAVNRWKVAGGTKMIETISADCWPAKLKPAFQNVDIAIARTQPETDNQPAITEIEQLYIDLIASAEKFVYAESQYFASQKIAAAIAERLREKNGPEIVILNPVRSEGWLEPEVMDTKRARLVKALMDIDHEGRFRIFHVLNEAGSGIYIHAKILIVDDRVIRVGSSNINNRSLGFDTEVDLAIDAGNTKKTAVHEQIARIRNDLLAEHLRVDISEIEAMFLKTGSLIETIEQCRSEGTTMRDYQLPDLGDVEEWLADHSVLDPTDADDNFAGFRHRRLRWKFLGQ